MQQIEIEIIGAEAPEARRAGTRDAVSGDFIALDLGDQEYAVALTGEYVTDELLGTAVPVIAGRIDQRHTEGDSGAQRIFLDTFGMPSLPEMPATLTERRHGSAVWKFHRSPRRTRCRAG